MYTFLKLNLIKIRLYDNQMVLSIFVVYLTFVVTRHNNHVRTSQFKLLQTIVL